MADYSEDEKQGIVQRMLDAGESEDNIATVIKSWTPFDVKAQNATMQKNMAAQSGAGKPESQWTLGSMAERGAQGLLGTAEGVVSGVTAPLALAYAAARHPVDTGMGALALGGEAIKGVRDIYNAPGESFDALKDAALAGAADPRTVGRVVGMAAAPRVTGMAVDTPLGKAAVAGTKDLALRVPGMQTALKVYQEAKGTAPVNAPKAVKAVKPPPTVEEQLGVSPDALGATMPETHAPSIQGRPVEPRQTAPVVDRTTPEALFKERPLYAQQQAMEEYGAQPDQVAPSRGRSTASHPQEGAGGRGSGAESAPVDEAQRREILRQLELRRMGVDEQGAREGFTQDNWHTFNGFDPNSNPGETQLLAPDEESWFAKSALSSIPDKANAPQNFEVVGNSGEPVTTINGSGGGQGPSAEELGRVAEDARLGRRYAIVGRGGKVEEIATQAGAQDINPGPGRTLVRIDAQGNLETITTGSKAGPMDENKRIIVGNRHAGHQPIDVRARMFDESVKRAREEGFRAGRAGAGK